MRRRMTDRLGATLAVLALLAVAPAATAAGTPDANLVAARTAAARILALTPLPPGATVQSSDPSSAGSLSEPVGATGGQIVDVHQYWTLNESPNAVTAYVRAHPPAGSSTAGEVSGGTGPYYWSETRQFAPVVGQLSDEQLTVAVAAAPGGEAAVRADAQVLWRPSWEEIPASSRAATVRLDGVAQRTVRGAGVRALRRLIDRQPVAGPGPFACPAGFPGQSVRVTFTAGGQLLARAGYDSADGCGFIGITIGGRRAPALFDGQAMVQQLWSLGSLAHCAVKNVAVSISRPARTAGEGSATITVRNLTRSPCSLDGDPSLTLLSAGGQALPIRSARQASGVGVATAPAHGKLSAMLSWPAPAHCARPLPATALVGLPGIAHRFRVAAARGATRLGPCRGRLSVGSLTMVP